MTRVKTIEWLQKKRMNFTFREEFDSSHWAEDHRTDRQFHSSQSAACYSWPLAVGFGVVIERLCVPWADLKLISELFQLTTR